jgi:uncharacterized protein YpmB
MIRTKTDIVFMVIIGILFVGLVAAIVGLCTSGTQEANAVPSESVKIAEWNTSPRSKVQVWVHNSDTIYTIVNPNGVGIYVK